MSMASTGHRMAAGWRSSARADSTEPERKPERKPEDGPAPDTRLIDTLSYQFNGAGFVHERFTRIWLIDAESGAARAPDPRQPP